MKQARPFVKWAGGKTQILPRLLETFPPAVKTYYEPFVGGGAVFWALAAQKRFERAVLNDFNAELMDAFRAIRDFPEEVIEQLGRLKWDKEVFLQLRAIEPHEFSPCRRAARFIYLNKSCFNGLYRVNKAGKFNVPFGKFKHTPKILDPDNIRACAEVLNWHSVLLSTDFVDAAETAEPGDLVYLDPPYIPINPTSNYTSYTSDGFNLNDQHRLGIFFKELADKGVHVVASNSDTNLAREIYKGYEIHEVQAKRHINSKGDKRGPVGELIIVGREA